MKHSTDRLPGTNLKQVLDQQGRRQDWLAAQLGVTPATVNRWVNGSRAVDRESANRIAVILGVPFSLIWNMPIGIETSAKGIEVPA